MLNSRHSDLEKLSVVNIVFRYNWHFTNYTLGFILWGFLMPYVLEIILLYYFCSKMFYFKAYFFQGNYLQLEGQWQLNENNSWCESLLSFVCRTVIRSIVCSWEMEGGLLVAKGWERESGKWLYNGYRVSFWGDEKVLELDSSNGCNKIVNLLDATELYSVKMVLKDKCYVFYHIEWKVQFTMGKGLTILVIDEVAVLCGSCHFILITYWAGVA